MSNVIVKELEETVSKALSSKDNLKDYKETIDKYLSSNTHKYFIPGPGERPIFADEYKNRYISLVGLTSDKIMSTIKNSKDIKSNWNIMNDPFNTALSLALRYFTVKKNEDYIRYTKWYLIVATYPSYHYKYFKHGVNESCMNYTIANLSGKYKMKQTANIWNTFTDMVDTAFELHKEKITKGEDKAFVAFIQDIHARMNSLIKNIASEYYDNYEHQRYLKLEHDIYDDDNYYESESNSYVIDQLANKVVTHMVVNGPDMKLVQLAAKTNEVSVNQMRNYTQTMINDKHRDEIRIVVESILYLFLNATDERHTPKDIGTNNFMIYCLHLYKRSNTVDPNIIRIKSILDKWLQDLGLMQKTTRNATVINFRRAFYTFFVMSIQKIAG